MYRAPLQLAPESHLISWSPNKEAEAEAERDCYFSKATQRVRGKARVQTERDLTPTSFFKQLYSKIGTEISAQAQVVILEL